MHLTNPSPPQQPARSGSHRHMETPLLHQKKKGRGRARRQTVPTANRQPIWPLTCPPPAPPGEITGPMMFTPPHIRTARASPRRHTAAGTAAPTTRPPHAHARFFFFFFFYLILISLSPQITHTRTAYAHSTHTQKVPTLFRGRYHYPIPEIAAVQSVGLPWHGSGRRASSRACENSRGR